MINKAFHISLAVMVYLSSLGFVLNAHYCKEELRSVSVYLPAKSCHDHPESEKQGMLDCPMHQASEKSAKDQKESNGDCCNDHAQFIKQDQQQQFELNQLSLLPNLIAAPVISMPVVFPQTDRHTVRYFNYKPPPLVCDLSISLQTFLC